MVTGFRLQPHWRLRPFTSVLETSASLALLKKAKLQNRCPIQALLDRTCSHLEPRPRARRILVGHSHLPFPTMQMGNQGPESGRRLSKASAGLQAKQGSQPLLSAQQAATHDPSLGINPHILCYEHVHPQ